MPRSWSLLCGEVLLLDRSLPRGAVLIGDGRIADVGPAQELQAAVRQRGEPCQTTDFGDRYLAPGFIDLHVHGGAGADFMDATPEAFSAVLAAHLRHGTTSIVPTTTVATHARIIAVLELCRQFQGKVRRDDAPQPLSRTLGCHFYGPYFNYDARGCHPGGAVRPPAAEEYQEYLTYADCLTTATIAPEISGSREFAVACAAAGVRVNAGHSNATCQQMIESLAWGVRHVDHLFCAMSDKTKLRQKQAYPMQGGVLEATLLLDELTTEVIADGRHLSADLLQLALKIKGPERLALVTDCSRALDMPDGRYVFGPLDDGVPFDRRDNVGIMPDGLALASSVLGMDDMVRTFAAQTGSPAWLAVRLASTTPARIIGWEHELGSLTVGRRADLLVLDRDLRVEQVYQDGARVVNAGDGRRE